MIELLNTQPIFDKVKNFVDKLFAYFRTNPPPVVVPINPPLVVVPIKRKQDREKQQNFSELLDHLEFTFDSVKLPTMSGSWVSKDSVVGLKKLGVHIPNPWIVHWSKHNSIVDVTKPLPAIMCISSASKNTVNTKYSMYPKILFAIKISKLPWHVSFQSGTPYQYGMAFDLEEKLFWINMYITVNRKTGEIKFCDELRTTMHKVPVKKISKNGARSTVFYNRSWQPPNMLEDELRTVAENKIIAKNCFASMHEWWSGRDDRWNVIVKNNGERITFGVNNDQTPYYFKDRDKSIKTESGQTRKIVHYVKEHERKIGIKTTVVKEHIRGLQEFDWSGYKCQVVSPKLQARTSSTFDAASVTTEDDKLENLVYLSKLGKLLASYEERKVA
jgi:hypothetical protein